MEPLSKDLLPLWAAMPSKIFAPQSNENRPKTPGTPNPKLAIQEDHTHTRPPKVHMESFSGIESFVRAADLLSFAEAGRALGISASAVGKNIAKLEAQLGLRLFHRTTRQVRLTQEGELFHERCKRVLDELHDARSAMQAAAETPRGKLRVSLPTIGYRFLLPVLPEFQRQYPEVELDLDFNDHLVDVIESGADVVIRSGDLTDSQLIARRLGPFRFVLAASPGYLEKHGTPQKPEDLSSHACLRYRFLSSGKLEEWKLKGLPPNAPISLVCNNMEAMLGASIMGMGIAYMPDFLASDAMKIGELTRVLENHLTHTGQFSTLWPSSRQLSPKVRAFVDFASKNLFNAKDSQ